MRIWALEETVRLVEKGADEMVKKLYVPPEVPGNGDGPARASEEPMVS